MDKLAELVDKCASTRGAPAAAELFQHIAQLLSEDIERDSILDSSLRSALFRVARVGAAARSNNPRAALALLDGAWLRCRGDHDRATLLAEAERLHAAAVRASTFEAAELDAWPDAADAAPPPLGLGAAFTSKRVRSSASRSSCIRPAPARRSASSHTDCPSFVAATFVQWTIRS